MYFRNIISLIAGIIFIFAGFVSIYFYMKGYGAKLKMYNFLEFVKVDKHDKDKSERVYLIYRIIFYFVLGFLVTIFSLQSLL